MSKRIPEIHISNVDQTEAAETPEEQSEYITDDETLDLHLHSLDPMLSYNNEVSVTDIDVSSVEEEFIPCQPIAALSTGLNISKSSEKLMNVHSPGKTRRSFTYFLKTPAESGIEDCLTDCEGVSASSEDDEELVLDFPQISLSSISDEKTKIKEHILTETIQSPAVTPEPIKLGFSKCLSHSPVQSCTDSELVYSDNEVPFRLGVNNGKSWLDGFVSDLEDSDTSLSDNPFVYIRKASLQHNKVSHSKMNARTRKISEPIPTEYIGEVYKGMSTMNKSLKVNEITHGKKKKNIPNTKKGSEKLNTIKSKLQNEKNSGYLSVKHETEGSTDIEDFDNEDGMSDVDIQTAAYVPESKREIVISNQNWKGDVALILPINKSSELRITGMESNDCGHSDVEELPDYVSEEIATYCPSPEPPHIESSFVQASEIVKDNCKLKNRRENKEPLTDTEEINISTNVKQKKMKIKEQNNNPFKPEIYNECLTDVEDLIMEKNNDNLQIQNASASIINTTDVEDISEDEIDEDKFYPEFDIVSSCNMITTKENLGPFSCEMRSKINKSIEVPHFKTVSPIPIFYNTELEDVSGEEDVVPLVLSSDCNLEPHSSMVHIRHSRMFKPKTDELKEFSQEPDPLTDVEDIEDIDTQNERDEDLHSDSPDGYSMDQKGPSHPEQPKK